MVKPPKTMQPEAVDLTKAGRKAGRAFQADSFHNYMARKIDLQRSQFGALLPPPPIATNETTSKSNTTTIANEGEDMDAKAISPSRRGTSSRKRPRPTTPGKSVSFAMLELVNPETTKAEQVLDSPHGISNILKKLQQRHGNGSRLALYKHKKRKSRLHPELCDEEPLFETEDPLESQADTDLMVVCRDQTIPSSQQQKKLPMDSTLHPAEDATPTSPLSQAALHHTTPNTESDDHSTPLSASKIRRDRPDLFFYGVVVKVNGYTNPDNETIKRLVQKHGGDFETYETERVTHIIAERLSTAKANMLKQQRRPRPVVSPTWIMDCIQAQRLLPHGDYLLPELKARDASQPGIKSLFAHKESKTRDSSTSLSTPPPTRTTTLSDWNTEKGKVLEDPSGKEEKSTKKQTGCSNWQMDGDDYLQHDPATILFLTQAHEGSDDNKPCQHAKPKFAPPELETSPKPITRSESDRDIVIAQNSPSHQDTVEKPPLEDTNTKANGIPEKEKSTGRTDGKYIDGKIRTVGTDPNFLDSFFANSRLSFIGSYRQRTSNDKTSTANLPSSDAKSIENCKRYIYHIDMDCFFANVVLRKYPQYRDKPVAISHHGKTNGDHPPGMDELMVSEKSTSECATCNYHARQFGIKKGMFLGRARQLCPDLVVLQYDFAGYEEVSEQVLAILHRIAAEYHGCVEPVSCDEAYMELYLQRIIADSKDTIQTTPMIDNHAGDIAEFIRQEIFETTECTASIGVAENKFLAKVGTDRVKPNGTFVVTDYREVLKSLRLRDLHGIGYRSEPKLSAEGLVTVQDVWDLGSKGETVLSTILGPGLGKKIFSFCQGRDDRQVKPAERKTIGAECNYGVRFDGPYGIDHFMKGLANEVAKRMEGVGCKGSKMTLKVKQRKKDAKPPPKFLGHGSCHNLSKSMDLPDSTPTRDAAVLAEVGMTLFRELAVALDDVRGMGMVISKLCPDDGPNRSPSKGGATGGIATFFRNSVHSSSDTSIAATSERNKCNSPQVYNDDAIAGYEETETNDASVNDNVSPIRGLNPREEMVRDTTSPGMLALPPLSQICMSQVAALPLELQEEIQSRFADRNKESFPPLDEWESWGSTRPHDPVMDAESKAPPGPKRTDSLKTKAGHEKQGLRQTNLKRMMKLVAVKSGQGMEGVSLTQLERLPLEIQLQIANEDSNPVGLLSQKGRPSLINRSTKSRQTNGRNGAWSEKRQDEAKVTIDVELPGESDREILIVNEDGEPNHNETDPELEKLAATSMDFFDDDIVPLQHFLDANSPLNSEAVDLVVDFFRICLEGRRMNVVPALVRSIKARSDSWSAHSVLSDIVQGVDEHHFEMYGSRLDRQWFLQD